MSEPSLRRILSPMHLESLMTIVRASINLVVQPGCRKIGTMRNITGSPTEGADFFNRHSELRQLRTELDNDANLLLTAPRRVGKTSLALKLCELRRKEKWEAAFFDAESCSDEASFADRLVRALSEQKIKLEGIQGVQAWLGGLRKHIEFCRRQSLFGQVPEQIRALLTIKCGACSISRKRRVGGCLSW